jgi:hypothetical protein
MIRLVRFAVLLSLVAVSLSACMHCPTEGR